MTARERLALPLPGGRVLDALVSGPTAGDLLIFHHGSPGAAVPMPFLEDAAAARGLRLATASRPGFGGSSRQPGRRVADAAPDIAALADHLGAERFFTLGWSGGGPHALACAALLPGRVRAVATMGGVAPYDAEGLDWIAGMGEDNQVEYPTAARDPGELAAWMAPHAEALAAIQAGDLVAGLRSLVSAVDEPYCAEEFGEVLAESFRTAFAHGPGGWFDDDLAFVSPWGFDLGAITVPVTLWQGADDLMVPYAHGQWLAGHIPGARAELQPEEGHLSIWLGQIGAILDGLLAAEGRASG
ncbi:MAG TPA: alpha/beta fold hydrolase [Actinomycetota bacterium]|nr:alpha/beta fold hydrolase [Actinomycetota bacterium]